MGKESTYVCVCVRVSLAVLSDSGTPRTVACQAPLSMEFSRQEYWSGLPFPSPIYMHIYYIHILFIYMYIYIRTTSQVVQAVKNLPTNAADLGDVGLIPGSGRSPGGGHSNPLQYSCLENPIDRGAWWPTVRGVAKSQT